LISIKRISVEVASDNLSQAASQQIATHKGKPMNEFDSLFVAGAWREVRGRERQNVINPYTETAVTAIRQASAEDVDDAVRAAAHTLHEGTWGGLPLEERCAVVTRIKAGLSARRDELIEWAVLTLGQPISRARQVSRIDSAIDSAIAAIQQLELEYRRISESGEALVVRRPVGVVAAICPWNAPTLTEVIKTISPLLAGCPVVLKPDPQTPYAALVLAEVAHEAGLPAGALNIVYGASATGEALVRHPLVRAVTFTGSTATGARIGSICGETFKRTVLELGGKSALIILDDADLDAAIAAADAGNFRNNGQACIGLTRILAPRRLHDDVVDALVARAEGYVLGDPRDDSTTMGPLATQRQRERVLGLIDSARADGARIATGGGRPEDQPHGWFVEPTVVTGVKNSSRIAQEEVFGPVATVLSYANENEAIAMANDSKYGLHGAVFAGDPDHALRVARRIESGTVGINCFGLTEFAPFGGVKGSGIGREMGPESFDAFLEYGSYTLAVGVGAVTAYNRGAS
jgi:aldehyde dehydrogenase (NAD+)